MSSSDSFLWLKYSGLPSLADIETKGEKFYAYKCKKYAYWDSVQSFEFSKQLLLESSAKLAAGETLEAELFEEVQRAWLLMQRWKLDKEQLSIEPRLSENFIKLQNILSLAVSNDRFLAAYLLEHGVMPETLVTLDDDELWEFLKAVSLADFFLADLKKFGMFSTHMDTLRSSKSDPMAFIACVNDVCYQIYDHLGYQFEQDAADFLGACLLDLGLTLDKPDFSFQREVSTAPKLDVLVSLQGDVKSNLLSFKFISDSMSLKLNPEHPLFKVYPELLDTKNPFYYALGQALIDHNVHEDVLTDFIYTLGAKLRMYISS